MRYLGCVTLDGALTVHGEAAPASLELECYELKDGVIHGTGEVTASPTSMRLFMGSGDVDFLTYDGHRLKLRHADKKAQIDGLTTNVLASGDLPTIRNGAAEWASGA